MKRVLYSILVMLFLVSLSGCQNQNTESSSSSKTQTLKIEDYYPIKENVKYIYEGNGNEYASYNVLIDYTSENKVQQRINNGGTESVKVMELKDGKLIMLMSKPETYYRENSLESSSTEQEILLKEPLEAGTSWTLPNNYKRKITDVSADVTVPAGNYKAIEVVTEGQTDKTIDYYASNIGLIKSVYISGDTEVSSSLSKIEQDASLMQTVSFFYPDVNENKFYYSDKDIAFKTNDITSQLLESAYKEIADKVLEKPLNTDVKINSLYLNSDNVVCIDLNQPFITELNAGAEYERMILQSIANTFGKYYSADKVILTIDSQPYESGHISMKKDEYIKVDFSGITKR